MRYRWIGESVYQFGNKPKAIFIGREPLAVEDEYTKRELLKFSNFKELPDGRLKKVSPVSIKKADGSRVLVDDAGYCELELSELDPQKAKALRKELVPE